MSFSLTSDFKPTGDQPNAIKSITDSFTNNQNYVTLQGVTGSGKTFTVANVIQELKKPTLVLAHNKSLLAYFRERNWPVLYPYVAPKMKFDQGRLAEKVPALMGVAAKGYEFVPDVAPHPEDILLPKKHPSAFFGTPLASYLIDANVDTLIVTGCTTSGCVRGSVVDGFAYNFRILVPEDAVYDRSATSHAVNLFDMASKYADVMPTNAALQHLAQIK